MVKLKAPLMSLKAQGRLSKLFSLVRRQGQNIIERRPIPVDAKSPAQLFNRHMFTMCKDLWHLLSDAEKQGWESAARPLHMSGYAWYISQCLRPNPGIYLPLAGGKMSGGIDMDGNEIEDIPDPAAAQDPDTLAARQAAFVAHIAITAAHHAKYTNGEAVTAAKTVKLDDFATPDDNADLNASAARHGLLKKLSGQAAEFLNGLGNWGAPAGGIWTLLETLSPSGVSTIDSSVLAAHDLWMVIMDVTFDTGSGASLDFRLVFNDDSGNKYFYRYVNGTSILSTSGAVRIILGTTYRSATAYKEAFLAQLLIQGKSPAAHAFSRIAVIGGGIGRYTAKMLLNAQWTCGTADVTKMTFNTSGINFSGKIKLYYMDY